MKNLFVLVFALIHLQVTLGGIHILSNSRVMNKLQYSVRFIAELSQIYCSHIISVFSGSGYFSLLNKN
jgi:hypothetical protein